MESSILESEKESKDPVRIPKLRGHLGMYILIGVILLMAGAGIFAPWLAPHDPLHVDVGESLLGPSVDHPFGTDKLGRDIFSRVMWGSRFAFVITAISITIALIIAILLGMIGGYLGGRIDLATASLLDLLYSFPLMLLALYIMASFGRTIWALVLATGLGVAPVLGRVIRAEVLRIKEEEYVKAVLSLGGSRRHILRRHILPNIVPTLIVLTTTTSVYALLIEASLSFLGLSLPPPTPTWGSIVAEGRANLLGAPWISLSAGLTISVLVVALNLLGDRLRDLLEAGG